MELELKHLSPYLPYDLKFLYMGIPRKIVGLNIEGALHIDLALNDSISVLASVTGEDIIPILRPLSDLTGNEHEVLFLYKPSTLRASLKDGNLPVDIYNRLLANHFDVFGLIEAGLAIDFNSIN